MPTMSRRDRLDGYRQALAEAGIPARPDLIAAGEGAIGHDDTHAAEHGRAAASSLLCLSDPPTAIVALNDMRAVGACAAVRDRGWSVPHDVSVAGIDDIALASLLYPPLTTVHQPIDKLSEAAVEILVGRLGDDVPLPPRHVMFDPHLVVRGSTAAPPLD
jgi:DNA-binding LacI/PurR family transcriptional regulator